MADASTPACARYTSHRSPGASTRTRWQRQGSCSIDCIVLLSAGARHSVLRMCAIRLRSSVVYLRARFENAGERWGSGKFPVGERKSPEGCSKHGAPSRGLLVFSPCEVQLNDPVDRVAQSRRAGAERWARRDKFGVRLEKKLLGGRSLPESGPNAWMAARFG